MSLRAHRNSHRQLTCPASPESEPRPRPDDEQPPSFPSASQKKSNISNQLEIIEAVGCTVPLNSLNLIGQSFY